MSDHSCHNHQSCLEMWRNSGSTNWPPRRNSQGTARSIPSALSDDDSRPPSALSNSDAPPPSALSDDDLRAPSALSSDVGSVRHAVSAMSITSRDHQGFMGQDEDHYARGPCSRLAENGSSVFSASERAVQLVLERERIQNNMVQQHIEAAEETLASFQLLVAEFCTTAEICGAEHDDEEHKVSDSIPQDEAASPVPTLGHRVSFPAGNHPGHRAPMRRPTPAVLSVSDMGYLADDERQSTTASRRKTRRSGSSINVSLPAPPPPTPEPLQSPAYLLRALMPSEVWDEEAPVEPMLYAPVPLRPLIEPELLLVGHNLE